MPDLSPLCAPILPGTEQSPIEQSQIYDKKPEWLKVSLIYLWYYDKLNIIHSDIKFAFPTIWYHSYSLRSTKIFEETESPSQAKLNQPFWGMADVIGVDCLVWVYTHKFTQTLLCCSIVSALSQKGLFNRIFKIFQNV